MANPTPDIALGIDVGTGGARALAATAQAISIAAICRA